ncbi:MAG: DNRLRE domain-containing protein [Bacteroidota bacterium]|nr:DNRLRE domain-containing protein [Bacteroidota bacterium]
MSIKFITITVLIWITTLQISKSQNVISIRLGPQTGQDVLVLSNFPTTNLNGHPDYLATIWTADYSEYIGRTFFQFYLNQIPSNAIISDARLSLYANPYPTNPPHSQLGYDNSAYLYRVQTDWNENSVTWNSQPEYTTFHKVTLPGTNNPNQNYPNIDVTQLVKDMIKEPDESFGFMLSQKDEQFFKLDCWDFWYRSLNFAPSTVADTSKRPLLVITYNTVGIAPINSNIPSNYKLSQNFPNPFNPVTKIKFDIPKSSFTSIKVFNELGQEISVLVSEILNTGSYETDWDGSNFSSGPYFIRLESGNEVITKRMMLIK